VIDCGKNFQAAALEWFPKYGLRKIDALLITHAHADAMNGLDDLRGWTLHQRIQDHIDVYVSRATFKEVQRSFPYLVRKDFATGGGAVPEFNWHIIEDKVPFEIGETGVYITPFAVHHGRIFSDVPEVPEYVPSPAVTLPPTPVSTPPFSFGRGGTPRSASPEQEVEVIRPYLCFGFKIREEIVYISDVSHIPDDSWNIIRSPQSQSQLPVCVLDCLRLREHPSHFGLAESVSAARKIAAKRTYFTGFSHDLTHDEYVTIGEIIGGSKKQEKKLTVNENKGAGMIRSGEKIWVRPAHDGLRVYAQDGLIRDTTYDA